MTGSVKVEGLRELRANLLKLTDRVQKNVLNRSVNAGARVIRDQAKQNAPRDTGELHFAIRTGKRRAPKGTSSYAVFLTQNTFKYANTKHNVRKRRAGKEYTTDGPAFYAKFFEFGSSKMSARPFMGPAFESKKHEAVAAIKRSLGEGIEKEAKKEGVRL